MMEKIRSIMGAACFILAFMLFALSAVYETDTIIPGTVNLTWVSSAGLAFLTLGGMSIYGNLVIRHQRDK